MSSSFDNPHYTRFHLRATAAPDVLPRCLDLLAKRNMVPAYWHSEITTAQMLDIEFHLDDTDAHLESYLAECLRRIINVETVVTSRAVARRQA
ncbi:MAG: hypothetical protein O3C65_03120 [Proteobacteria bacterium]|nr:hypothetical protein [Pseudomonadota bacterium]MDA1057653.1 hypothetical protein [Pseudomonadota bacterium]